MAVVSSGDDERVYLTCFDDGAIQIVDPRGVPTVERTVSVGRGPYAAVASNLRQRVYVTNFLEDTISVRDADVTSAHYGRVVMRIAQEQATLIESSDYVERAGRGFRLGRLGPFIRYSFLRFGPCRVLALTQLVDLRLQLSLLRLQCLDLRGLALGIQRLVVAGLTDLSIDLGFLRDECRDTCC